MNSDRLAIVLDGRLEIYYDRTRPLPEHQRQALERMDAEMEGGITLGDQRIATPDLGQRAQFVAMRLVRALGENDESLMAATTSYLALRLPDLKQVRTQRRRGHLTVQLVFDRDYVPESPVKFMPRSDLR